MAEHLSTYGQQWNCVSMIYIFICISIHKSFIFGYSFSLPGTCLSSILGLQPSKTSSFPIKTGVIWVPGKTNMLTFERQKLFSEALPAQSPQSPGISPPILLHQGAANHSDYAARFVGRLQDIVATCASDGHPRDAVKDLEFDKRSLKVTLPWRLTKFACVCSRKLSRNFSPAAIFPTPPAKLGGAQLKPWSNARQTPKRTSQNWRLRTSNVKYEELRTSVRFIIPKSFFWEHVLKNLRLQLREV